VAGEHINWYYCDSEFWISINRENVEKMFNAVDKTFWKMTIVYTFEDEKNINFIFKDADIDKECHYKIILSTRTPDEDLYSAEEILSPEYIQENFPVAFTLSSRQFKKSVIDALNYSATIAFEKIGDHPLQLTYNTSTARYCEVYRSPSKINLFSTVPANTAFRAVANLGNLKALASSMVTDSIRIFCRSQGDLLFQSAINEKALVVSCLTKSV
jgi:hypothetical protein